MEKIFHVLLQDDHPQISGDAEAVFGERNDNVFASWLWDGETLTVKNDRYGFYPLYYYAGEREFVISPSIEQILRVKNDIRFDEPAFAVFLRLGWVIGDDTIFEQIKAVPPDSILTWQRGELRIEQKPRQICRAAKIEYREAIRTYAELFQAAVEKNIPSDDDFAVPLSGGRDSRHILFALEKAGHKPQACLTLLHPPPRPNEDARIAAMICERLKIRHVLIDQPGSRFQAEVRKNEITGFMANEHGWFVALADFVRDRYDRIYDGIAGDVLSTGLFLTEKRLRLLREENFKELANDILGPEGYLPRLLTQESYQKFNRELAVGHLQTELEKHAAQPNPVEVFYFWNRTRRCIALSPFRIIGGSKSIMTPFLDPELFDFLCSLSGEFLFGSQFHTDTISYAYPKLADIPYEKINLPRLPDIENYRKFSRDILRSAMTPRREKLTRRSFFLTRCLRCQFDAGYASAAAEFGEQATLLLQLERL